MGIIGSIRKHSWIAVAIVGIAIIAFIIGDLTKRSGGADVDMAEVNGVSLNRIQFENMINREEAKIRLYAQDPSLSFNSEMEKVLRDSLWANFVDETVIDEQTKKLGLMVSDAEEKDMYTGEFVHPLFLQNPQLRDSAGQYNRALMASQMKAYNKMDTVNRLYWNETKKMICKDRLRQKYATLVYSGFYMPQPIAKKIAEYGSKGVNVSVVSMPYAQVNDAEVNVTDADYQKYYDEHKEDYRNWNEEMRMLEYVTFVINPSAKDFAAAQDSAMSAWNNLRNTPDNSRELPRLVKAESIREYTYDSTYHRASFYPAAFGEKVEAAAVGTEIEPMQIGDKWFMGRVMNIQHRPDSIRTSVLFVFSNKLSSSFQRDSAQADVLSDSILSELNAGRLEFGTAVENFCDLKLRGETPGDLNWQMDGTLDLVYNSIFEQVFKAQVNFFKGVNEQIVNTPAGGQFRFTLPDELGYAIVKVTEKTAPVKKYRMAVIAQEIRASNETVNEIQNAAYKFLSDNRSAKAFEESARKQNMQVMTAYVHRMDDRVNNLDNARDVVKWAFNANTKVGDVNGDMAALDNLYAVVMLKEIYQKGYYTLAQVRANPSFNIDQAVRTEKRIEIQMAKAEKMAKQCKNIQDVAAALNDSIVVIDSVSLFGDRFGAFGMEPKVQAVASVSKTDGLIGPIKGARGVYFVQVSNRFDMQQIDPEQLRLGQEFNSRRSIGMVQRGRYLSMDRRIFWWLRSNANVNDHRDLMY